MHLASDCRCFGEWATVDAGAKLVILGIMLACKCTGIYASCCFEPSVRPVSTGPKSPPRRAGRLLRLNRKLCLVVYLNAKRTNSRRLQRPRRIILGNGVRQLPSHPPRVLHPPLHRSLENPFHPSPFGRPSSLLCQRWKAKPAFTI